MCQKLCPVVIKCSRNKRGKEDRKGGNTIKERSWMCGEAQEGGPQAHGLYGALMCSLSLPFWASLFAELSSASQVIF